MCRLCWLLHLAHKLKNINWKQIWPFTFKNISALLSHVTVHVLKNASKSLTKQCSTNSDLKIKEALLILWEKLTCNRQVKQFKKSLHSFIGYHRRNSSTNYLNLAHFSTLSVIKING